MYPYIAIKLGLGRQDKNGILSAGTKERSRVDDLSGMLNCVETRSNTQSNTHS